MALENRRVRRGTVGSIRRRCGLATNPIAGKTVLLHAEQGFGDTIQFIRYAPLLARRGAKVDLRGAAGAAAAAVATRRTSTVIACGEPLPAFDLHCPLLSLPLAFGTQPATIPADVPYLAASAERCAYWRDRLPAGRPRAGFVWSGSPSHKNDGNRSIRAGAACRMVRRRRRCDASAFRASCATPIARCCAACRT